MSFMRQYRDLLQLSWRSYRDFVLMIGIVNIGFGVGLVLGFGYVIPDIPEATAMFLVTGAATQMIVTVGIVGLPQVIAQAKSEGRLDYYFTLPISREAYLLAQVTFVLLQSLPALVLALLFGAWNYGFSLEIDPLIVLVVPLGVLSLAGLGVAVAVISPHMQLTNAFTQLSIFYVLFFAPVILPKEQLPLVLRHAADFLPPTYVADGIRATTTNLPDTHVWRSILAMAGFGVGSLALAAGAVRRRG